MGMVRINYGVEKKKNKEPKSKSLLHNIHIMTDSFYGTKNSLTIVEKDEKERKVFT